MVMRRSPTGDPLNNPKSQSLFSDEKIRENPAATDAVTAYVDGGARGNPGPAGYGVYIQDATGKKLAELSEYLGHKTNNHAEYSGLLAALDYAVKHSHAEIKVVSDSELMVKQLRGEYKVKSPELKELYDKARALVRKLSYFEIRHVMRGENKNADRLANEAMDRGSGRTKQADTLEVNGIVKNGVVEFLGEELPEGTMVKVRKSR